MEARVTATKIRGRSRPVPQPGFTPIFPNNWHGHAFQYGTGDFSSLSPMQLGPTTDNAFNIENYYQFSKVFPNELSEEVCDCGSISLGEHFKPGPKFYEARAAAFADKTPHRHKQKNVIPAYSAYGNPEVHCDYIESRWYYCSEMERLGSATPAFKRLYDMFWVEKKSLEIFGYDAYPPNGTDVESLYAHYCDPKRPFGHELVILTMIVLKPEEYPWKRERPVERKKIKV